MRAYFGATLIALYLSVLTRGVNAQEIIARYDGATLQNIHGVDVLYLNGTHNQMMNQHAYLLREKIRDGVIPVMATAVKRGLTNATGSGALSDVALALINNTITNRMIDNIPARYKESYSLLAKTTGIEHKKVLEGALALSINYLILPLIVSDNKSMTMMGPSCSGFMKWGPLTKTGKMIMARNWDFPLNGYADRDPLVTYFEPADGQRYMTFGSPGIHNEVIQGVNSSGIFVGLHTSQSTSVSRNGVSILHIMHEIIRLATSFDHAVQIAKSMKAEAGWNISVASMREQRAGTIEVTSEKVTVRESYDHKHIQTNHFISESMRPLQLYVNKSIASDSEARYRQLETRLSSDEPIGFESAIEILADQNDPLLGRRVSLGNTVSVHTSLQSLVVDEGSQAAYLSVDLAPSAHGRFAKFSLPFLSNERILEINSAEQEPISQTQKEMLPGHWKTAMQEFIKAKVAYEISLNNEVSWSHLEKAVAEDQDNSHIRYVAAMIALKTGRKTISEEYLRLLLNAEDLQRKHLSHFFLARIYAAEGKVAEASLLIDALLGQDLIDIKLKNATIKMKKKLAADGEYRFDFDKLNILFQQADHINY
jgi:hypothetical protein